MRGQLSNEERGELHKIQSRDKTQNSKFEVEAQQK